MYRTRKWLTPFIIILDKIGSILLLHLRFKSIPDNQRLKIAVFRFEYFGDMLLSFPFFKNLKKNYPDSHITVFSRTLTKELIINNTDIDEIIEINTPWFSRGDNDGYMKVFKYAFKNLSKYDFVFDLHPDPRNIIFARLIGKYSIGFGTRGLGFFLNKEVDFIPGKSVVLRYLDQISAIGGKIFTTETDVYSKEDDRIYIQKLLKEKNIDINNIIVCINPGTSSQSKTWQEEYFSQLIDLLLNKNQNLHIIIVDVKNDERIKRIIAKVKNIEKVSNLSGLCSVKQFIELVKFSDIYIGLDSFGTHVAAAVKTPLVNIFSATTYKEEFGPFAEKKIILQKNPDCAYCGKDICENNICMKNILPTEVVDAVEYFIQELL